jgi:hypothetical protein
VSGAVDGLKDAAGFAADTFDGAINKGVDVAHKIDNLKLPAFVKYNPLLAPIVGVKESLGEVASAGKLAKDLAVNLGKAVVTGDFKGGDPAQLALGTSSDEFQAHTILEDPPALYEDDPAPSAKERAELATKATAARAELAPEQAAQYDAIAHALEGNAQGEDTLHRLAASGKLKGDEALVKHLGEMAKQPLAEGIDRQQLLTETLRAVENPVRMDQEDTNTCGGVSAQIMLALKNPAEYVRLVGGLSTPEGSVKLAGGETIRRDAEWQNPEKGAGRALGLKLLTPPLMDMAQLPGLKHDAKTDENKLLGHNMPGFLQEFLGEGNLGMGEAKVASQLMGEKRDMHLFSNTSRDKDWDTLKQTLDAGRGPITTGMYYRPPGRDAIQHYVLIEGVKDGQVTFVNPWGKRERISEADYKSHIFDAALPE